MGLARNDGRTFPRFSLQSSVASRAPGSGTVRVVVQHSSLAGPQGLAPDPAMPNWLWST